MNPDNKVSLESILSPYLGPGVIIDNYYLDNQGFFLKLKGKSFWYRIEVGGMFEAEEVPDGGLNFKEIEN